VHHDAHGIHIGIWTRFALWPIRPRALPHSQIQHHESTVRIQPQVGGLDVSVGNVLRMQVGQAPRQLADDGVHHRPRGRGLPDERGERQALDQLGDQPRGALVHASVAHGHQIVVREGRQQLRFALERVAISTSQDLERSRPARTIAAVHRSGRAFPDEIAYDPPAQVLPRPQRRGHDAVLATRTAFDSPSSKPTRRRMSSLRGHPPHRTTGGDRFVTKIWVYEVPARR
jgi:hypothetical protein